jgi:hypothetical protein
MFLVTTFADGSTVSAVPAVDADIWESLHDAVHGAVADALRLEHSPVLWGLASGTGADPVLAAREEAAVLALVEYVRELHRR